MEPEEGIEPATPRLGSECSAAGLLRRSLPTIVVPGPSGGSGSACVRRCPRIRYRPWGAAARLVSAAAHGSGTGPGGQRLGLCPPLPTDQVQALGGSGSACVRRCPRIRYRPWGAAARLVSAAAHGSGTGPGGQRLGLCPPLPTDQVQALGGSGSACVRRCPRIRYRPWGAAARLVSAAAHGSGTGPGGQRLGLCPPLPTDQVQALGGSGSACV